METSLNPSSIRPVRHDLPPKETVSRSRAWFLLGCLIAGYIGVYLCRKNYSVAVPLLQSEFGVSRKELGLVASFSTVAYALGKVFFGPVIDYYGGRVCLLLSFFMVALFGWGGATAGSIGVLGVFYSANRLSGSASWGGMVKLVPQWFAPARLPLAMGWLSLSFVFGGVLAILLAGQIAAWSGNDWRMVMGIPSIVLVSIAILLWWILPRAETCSVSAQGTPLSWRAILNLFSLRQFGVVAALSFTLTMLRETFNTWTVDFLKTQGGPEMSMRLAAFLSTPFDACGAVGILAIGWAFSRLNPAGRMRLLFMLLSALSLLIYSLPALCKTSLAMVTMAIGLIGFLAYGPYSLLGGILAVEIKGPSHVATVAGAVDGIGYLAGFLSGYCFGWLVDARGYSAGFMVLSGLALLSAFLCLFLYPKTTDPSPVRAK